MRWLLWDLRSAQDPLEENRAQAKPVAILAQFHHAKWRCIRQFRTSWFWARDLGVEVLPGISGGIGPHHGGRSAESPPLSAVALSGGDGRTFSHRNRATRPRDPHEEAGLNVLMAEVTGFDLANKRVLLDSGHRTSITSCSRSVG